MFLAILGFIVVAGSIIGGYFAVTYMPGMLAGRRLEQRIRDVSVTEPEGTAASESTLVSRGTQGPLPAIDRFVEGSAAGSWLNRLIQQSGVKTTPSGILVISLGLGVVTALAGSFTRYWWAPLATAPIGLVAPTLWLMNRRSARLRKFEEQFPEALDLIGRAIRAGHAFQTAMGMAADELPPPVGPEFKKAFDQHNFGLPLREALDQLAVRVPSLDVRFFVTAVQIQRETGGNLAEILDNLAHVVRERFKIQRQIRVHTAHGRFTGYVLVALPAALAVALSYINPEHMNLLFREHMGQVLLIIAMVMQTIGFFWIRYVIKIEV
jgi:tight adherence protein B